MAEERIGVKESLHTVLPGGHLTERMKRLFWFREHPPDDKELKDPRELLAAVANILSEGDMADWRALDQRMLRSIAEDLPLFGADAAVWIEFFKEENEMADRRQLVLDDEQREILRLATQTLPQHKFELAGGTALAAAYLGHRRSEDLDFFTSDSTISAGLHTFLEELQQKGIHVDVERDSPSFARLYVGKHPVKVELGVDSPYHLQPSDQKVEGMPVRSLPDLAADKTLALFGRATTRDFVDVYQLSRTHYDINELMKLAAQKDPGFDVGWFAKALGQVTRVNPHDVTMLIPFDFDRMRDDLLAASRRILRRELDRSDDPER